jgi:hypothetical protein
MKRERYEANAASSTEQAHERVARRSFLKGMGAVGAAGALAPAQLLANQEEESGRLSRGDAAILRFLAAAEIIETDLWQQYNELGGIQDSEVPGGSGSPIYTDALKFLDGDMDQYIHDNTEDELSHEVFINAYLKSKGADTVNLDAFRILPSSKATGAQQIGRLTNLMQLTVDTSWWTRYRSRDKNPDLDPGFVFPNAIPGLAAGKFPAIPRNDADLTPHDHIQAIANTAGFHFAFIEQGGTSLYPSLAQRVSSPEVLRILLSIGPTETAHFQTWHDKAGNYERLTDPTNGLEFPELNTAALGEDFQTNLIMPEPTTFLSKKFPPCSIIRPTATKGAAMGAVKALAGDGLFIGQTQQFFALVRDLAEDADEARREGFV